jgi:Rrf2 family protein
LFRLSTKSSYGLRACLALACSSATQPLAVADLSRDNQIPRRYLEQILNALRHKGLVASTRGARGGYKLSRGPSSISIGEIVRAVEGEMDPILCSVPEMRSQDCRTTTGCVSRRLCYDLETTLLRVLDGTTLEDMRLEALRLQGTPERETPIAIALSKLLPV